jgi:hypothetical protein
VTYEKVFAQAIEYLAIAKWTRKKRRSPLSKDSGPCGITLPLCVFGARGGSGVFERAGEPLVVLAGIKALDIGAGFSSI